MDISIQSDIIEILACPECGGHLRYDSGKLKCRECACEYEVRDGIPMLFPDNLDTAHLEEEEKLGELMENPLLSSSELFYERQWEDSKQEYWAFVKEKLGTGGKVILNAGCGIDVRFLDLGKENTLIAFDLMQKLLYTLRSKHGSTNNIAGDVRSLPFRRDSFDCLCCIDLIHHENDKLPQILASFHKALKPGGILLLEDVNAWGLFQFWKSILLPRPVHGALRSIYHRLKRSSYQPADYEFPTSVWKVKKLLSESGFREIEAVGLNAYPVRHQAMYRLYKTFSGIGRIRKYHNFHYLLFARK